ncbi:MFS transporter [Agromyces sp. MMS24-K17]|uniref:MFS transporter n=1 Tax=Agromyces sp. MMS24-K17 TaxID=3372850 RepID=UPI003754BD9C
MTDAPGEGRLPLLAGRTLAFAGILLVAFNLRTAVASLSPVLHEVEADIALNPVQVGVLGMLPPLCFAVFGIATPVFAKGLGLERTLVIALGGLVLGLLGRALAGDAAWLLAASALTFAAIGVGNVLLPPLVKRYFPDRVGLMTTVYVSAMSVSTFVPPLIAAPVVSVADWRISIGLWAVFALSALVPWVALLVHPSARAGASLPEEADPAQLRHLVRSPLAWALATIFAVSSVNAYTMFAWLPRIVHDLTGADPATGGALLSLYAAMGLPAALAIPVIAARTGRVRLLVGVGIAAFVIGYLGLLLVPATATALWIAIVGLGPLLFPLAMVLINLRTRTHAAAVALSGFVQSGGYLVAALGPIAIGLVRDATGSWTLPLVLLLATALPATVAGVVVARPRFVEDERGAPAG